MKTPWQQIKVLYGLPLLIDPKLIAAEAAKQEWPHGWRASQVIMVDKGTFAIIFDVDDHCPTEAEGILVSARLNTVVRVAHDIAEDKAADAEIDANEAKHG